MEAQTKTRKAATEHAESEQRGERVVSRAKSAMEKASDIAPDLAVLDHELPDLQGMEIMRALHAVPGCEETSVVLVTGRAKPPLVRELKEAGAVEVLGKPFSPLQLIRRAYDAGLTQVHWQDAG